MTIAPVTAAPLLQPLDPSHEAQEVRRVSAELRSMAACGGGAELEAPLAPLLWVQGLEAFFDPLLRAFCDWPLPPKRQVLVQVDVRCTRLCALQQVFGTFITV